MTPLLHRGEIEAICLGLENDAKLCLMDDKDGREIAINCYLLAVYQEAVIQSKLAAD